MTRDFPSSPIFPNHLPLSLPFLFHVRGLPVTPVSPQNQSVMDEQDRAKKGPWLEKYDSCGSYSSMGFFFVESFLLGTRLGANLSVGDQEGGRGNLRETNESVKPAEREESHRPYKKHPAANRIFPLAQDFLCEKFANDFRDLRNSMVENGWQI